MSDWEPKQQWKKRGKDFAVVVSRHEVHRPHEQRLGNEGPYRWCIYAFIYPTHPHFAAFDGTDRMWQEAALDLPLHCGPSLLTPHFDRERKLCSIEVGADYNHLHDEPFTRMATKEEAGVVFADAEELFAWLDGDAGRAPSSRGGGR